MGLCQGSSSKTTMMNTIEKYAIQLVVQRSAGSTGDTESSFLKNLIASRLPGASITEQIVPNASPGLFNVLSAGQLIHSTEKDGSVSSNAEGIISKLTGIAKEQVGMK